jgi:hypothetical protein
MPLARDMPQGRPEPGQKSLRAFRIAKGKHAALPFPLVDGDGPVVQPSDCLLRVPLVPQFG